MVKLNAKQEVRLADIARKADYQGVKDVKSIRDYRRLHDAKVKAADKMLAILAPPKATPIKIGGLGSA